MLKKLLEQLLVSRHKNSAKISDPTLSSELQTFYNSHFGANHPIPVNSDQILQVVQALAEDKELKTAKDLISIWLRHHPADLVAQLGLGNIHFLNSDYKKAREMFDLIVAKFPKHGEAHYNLTLTLKNLGERDKALHHAYQALDCDFANEGILDEIADLVTTEKELELAIERLTKIPMTPAYEIALHKTLGAIYLKKALDPSKALEHLLAALSQRSDDTNLHNNLGIAYQDLKNFELAEKHYNLALELDSENHSARFHRGLLYLAHNQFEYGWNDYESRLHSIQYEFPSNLSMWDCKKTGQKILVRAEQGIGDQIMFASCLNELKQVQQHIVLECEPKLVALFQRSFPDCEILDPSQPSNVIRGLDCQTSLGSIPRVFRNDISSFDKSKIPYLIPDPKMYSLAKMELGKLPYGTSIGISWRGGTSQTRAAARSISLETLAPIFELQANFVCLQYGDCKEEIERAQKFHQGRLHYYEGFLDEFDATAAMTAACDIVISVCTAAIHLAGALGVNTFVLTPHVVEWRYGVKGTKMPWYPTIELVRQSTPGDWNTPINRVRNKLDHLIQQSNKAI